MRIINFVSHFILETEDRDLGMSIFSQIIKTTNDYYSSNNCWKYRDGTLIIDCKHITPTYDDAMNFFESTEQLNEANINVVKNTVEISNIYLTFDSVLLNDKTTRETLKRYFIRFPKILTEMLLARYKQYKSMKWWASKSTNLANNLITTRREYYDLVYIWREIRKENRDNTILLKELNY